MTGSGAQATLQLVADTRAEIGEGPTWDAGRAVLWWVDIMAGRLHRFDPASAMDRSIDVGSPVGAVALRRSGTLLLALAEGLASLTPDEPRGPTMLRALGTPGDGLRCNDAKCDPAGRCWVGRMAIDLAARVGSLVRVDADLAAVTRLTGLTVPNGLGWSLDGRTMYFTDSAWGEVRAYPYDPLTGTMGDGRTLVGRQEDGSMPDGLTVDADGHLWVARWDGGSVDRIDPNGQVEERVTLPVSRVTSCAFGGADLGDLYITTARGDGDQPAEPYAGGLFLCRPAVGGLLPVPFAG